MHEIQLFYDLFTINGYSPSLADRILFKWPVAIYFCSFCRLYIDLRDTPLVVQNNVAPT